MKTKGNERHLLLTAGIFICTFLLAITLPSHAGSIGDTVFHDLNNNGVQDIYAPTKKFEPGIEGVTVTVFCETPFGPGTIIAATDANGKYLVSGIPTPAMCTISVDPNSSPALDDKIIGQCPLVIVESLEDGEVFLDADFCFKSKPGSIGDTVFCDVNDDGVQDLDGADNILGTPDDEPGIPGVSVTVYCEPENFLPGQITVKTDANGNYLVGSIPTPATCIVTVDVGSAPDDKIPGKFCPIKIPVQLGDGEPHNFLDADFCFKNKPGSIGDTVFCDLNDNGMQDDEEPGIEGVTVNLECRLADGSTDSRSTATDADGKISLLRHSCGRKLQRYCRSFDSTR